MSVETSRRVQAQSNPRPFVLWVLIVLHIVQAAGSLFLLGLIALIDLDSPLIAQLDVSALQQDGEYSIILVSSAILLIVHLVLAYGLWRLQRWAWVMTMITLAISMTLDILSFLDGTPDYFSMLINVLLVFYLNQAEILELFASPIEHDAHE